MALLDPATPVPFGRPQIDNTEIDAVAAVLRSGMLVHGQVTHDFEHAFAERAGAKHAIAVSSCTAGLHLALFVNDIGPGDKVAVPAMTHVATAHVVELQRATPVFIDVDPATGNMDPDALDAAAKTGLKAVMPVHYLGLPCDMDRINAIAKSAGALVVEDCALALDATYGGAKAGTLADCGSFSFYPVKHMTTIEGGMVTTNNDALAAQLSKRRSFGYNRQVGERSRPGLYDVDALGFNYRMSEVAAAVGMAQLAKLDYFQAARAANHTALAKILAQIEGVTVFPDVHGKARSSHYCLNLVLPRDQSVSRDDVQDALKARGVGTSIHYPGAVPLFTYYRNKYGYRQGQFPVAEWLAAKTISLPIGPHLPKGGAEAIGKAVIDAVAEVRKQ